MITEDSNGISALVAVWNGNEYNIKLNAPKKEFTIYIKLKVTLIRN